MTCSVLVVEDDAIIALGLEAMLNGAGYRVVGPASSVAEALPFANEELDAAILDVNLAQDLVYPVAEALAAADVPFVLVTGQSMHSLPEQYRSRPIVNKPYGPLHLLDVLGCAIATHIHRRHPRT